MWQRLNRWFQSQRRSQAAPGRALRIRPQLELLEDRLAPAVFNVNSLADVLAPPAGVVTLRSAIQAANATPGGNTINLTIAGAYKITLAGTPGETDNAAGEFAILPAGGNLNIVNTSGGTVVVDGGGQNRVFDINPGNTNNPATKILVTMQGFTIQNGFASPNDLAPGSGGGVRDQGNSSLTLTTMVVTNNSATADGGGVSMENFPASTPWTLTLNATTVSNNRAGDAGGGVETDGTGQVFINAGSVITGNSTVNQGGGIWLDAIGAGSANLTIIGAVVSNNSAFMIDGGIGNAGNGAVSITASTIANNISAGDGGGFGDQNNLGTLTVLNSSFLNNSAGGVGGGVQEGGPSTTITNTLFQGDSSNLSGGGLFAAGTTLIVNAATFVGNTAALAGAGAEVETTGTGAAGSTITNTTLTGNRVLSNTQAGNGGGIDAPTAFTGLVALLNDTVNANSADNGGGIFWAGMAGSTFTLQNTIVAQNTASIAGPDANNAASAFTDLGGNLIGVSGAGSGNTGFTNAATQKGTVATPLNPMLGPLANNGGPTVGATGSSTSLNTEALLPGSPALDKGVTTALTVDERTITRPDGGAAQKPDVGAFEFQNATLTLTVTQTGAPTTVGGVATFTITVTNTGANALPADNSTVTLTLPAALTAAGPLTFTVGPLAPGQSQTFVATAIATVLGAQTVSATVTSPDTNPNSVTANGTVSVLTAQERFVQALYLDELGRAGSISELDGWVTILNSTSQFNVANSILRSAEARDHLVKGWYVTFLGRQAQGGEEQTWVNQLLAGQTEEQVLSNILGTSEFFNHAQTLGNPGTPNQQYVEALYQLLLNRTGDSGGVSFWSGQVSVLGQASVALAFLKSMEYRTDAITGYYNNLLHRPPDSAGLTGWVNSNLDLASVRVQFESTGEFFAAG